MIFNALFCIRDNPEIYVQSPYVTLLQRYSTSAIAVSPSVVIAVPAVFFFKDTVAAFLGFQSESSLCRVRCQIPLHRAN
jgi:hypothetical protein